MIRLRFSKLQNDPLIWLAAFHAETAGTWTPWFVDSLLLIRVGLKCKYIPIDPIAGCTVNVIAAARETLR
jgi:hypothetical protein